MLETDIRQTQGQIKIQTQTDQISNRDRSDRHRQLQIDQKPQSPDRQKAQGEK